jgi:peptidoglycan/LPS O-acetylase OafA/YrhL
MNSESRSAGLDILRSIAVGLVLLRHMPAPPTSLEPVQTIVERARMGGWCGVDLFFALSGFLVGRIILRGAGGNRPFVKRFLVRRGFKIYPPFLLFLVVSTAVLLLGASGTPVTLPRFLTELFFLRNYREGLFQHTWSLSVEEHFYLLLALLGWRFRRVLSADPSARIPRGLLALTFVLVPLVLRVVNAAPFANEASLFPTHLRIDTLAWGVIAAWWSLHRPLRLTPRGRTILLAIGASPFALPFILPLESSWFLPRFGLTLLGMGGAALAIAVDGVDYSEATKHRALRLAARAGQDSYSIYLWHLLCLGIANKLMLVLHLSGVPGWFGCVLLYMVMAIVAGRLLSAWIEQPALNLRARFGYG